MTTEKLIVELKADTGNLDAALSSSTKKIDDLDKSTNKADLSFSNLAGTSVKVAGGVAAVGAAAVTAAGAVSTMIVMAGKNRQELEQLARQAKLTVEEFSALSFATKQYGIDGEGIADISKDIADKMGEFGKVGTGAFQDVADILGMTKEEAQALSISMEDMSGEQVIGTLISRMEDAGASTNEMTFAMESMGNDLSKLIPLFSDNGSELEKLKGQYSAATLSMKLTREEAEKLKDSAVAFDALTSSLSAASNKILSTIAGPVTDFFENLVKIIPLATEDLKNFIDSFNDESAVSTINLLSEKQEELNQRLLAESKMAESGMAQAPELVKIRMERIDALKSEIVELEILADARKKAEAGVVDGGQSGGSSDKKMAAVEREQEIIAEIRANNAALERERVAEDDARILAAIKDRFKAEADLLQEKLDFELEKAGEDNELKRQLKQEHSDKLMDISEKQAEKEKEIAEKSAKDAEKIRKSEEKDGKDKLKASISNAEGALSAAQSLNSALLEDNKAVGAGMIIADTAIAFTKALAQEGAFGWGQAAAIAASGATQLANLNSASRSGGSISASQPDVQTASQPETSDVSVLSSDAQGAGAGEIVVRFEGGGDDVTEAIANNMTVLQRNGVLT